MQTTYLKARIRNRDLMVMVNPSLTELRKVAREVRMVVDLVNKNIYFWDAIEATYDSVIPQLPIGKNYIISLVKFKSGMKKPEQTQSLLVRGKGKFNTEWIGDFISIHH